MLHPNNHLGVDGSEKGAHHLNTLEDHFQHLHPRRPQITSRDPAHQSLGLISHWKPQWTPRAHWKPEGVGVRWRLCGPGGSGHRRGERLWPASRPHAGGASRPPCHRETPLAAFSPCLAGWHPPRLGQSPHLPISYRLVTRRKATQRPAHPQAKSRMEK